MLPHPRMGRSPGGDAQGTGPETGLENNLLYLLLQAVNAYQSAYLPKQQALGLSVSEARILILLSALNQARVQILQRESSLPGSEIREALDNLAQSGLVEREEDGNCRLSPAGQERARQYWALSEQEQQQVFAEFDPSGSICSSRFCKASSAGPEHKNGSPEAPVALIGRLSAAHHRNIIGLQPLLAMVHIETHRCPSFSDRWPHPRILR